MALTLLLKCKDPESTRQYYAATLGFAVTDGAQGILTVEKEGARLIFTAENLWKKEAGCSGTIYIGVKDIEGFYEAVAGNAEVAWPLQTMSYGTREFGLIDCNGYMLAFHAQA